MINPRATVEPSEVVETAAPEDEHSQRRPMTSQRRAAWAVFLVALPAAAAIWSLTAGAKWPHDYFSSSVGFLVLAMLSVATWTDLDKKKIPNWVTYSGCLWGWLLGVAVSYGASPSPTSGILREAVRLSDSLLGTVICFLTLFFIFRLAGGGAGDVKLAAAIGALLGPERGVTAIVWTYIVAGIWILLWMTWTIGPLRFLALLARKVGSLLLPLYVTPPAAPEDQQVLKYPVRLAPFFAIGTLAVLTGLEIAW